MWYPCTRRTLDWLDELKGDKDRKVWWMVCVYCAQELRAYNLRTLYTGPEYPGLLVAQFALTWMFVFLLQIRQEKPYYIADPEVDSLVSFHSFFVRMFKVRVCRL